MPLEKFVGVIDHEKISLGMKCIYNVVWI